MSTSAPCIVAFSSVNVACEELWVVSRLDYSQIDFFLLQHQTRAHLYENLGLWMKHVAEDKLQVHVESLGLQQFQDDLRPQRLSLCRSLLRGLNQAMALPNPPNNCWSILCSTTEKIFTLLPNHIQVQGGKDIRVYAFRNYFIPDTSYHFHSHFSHCHSFYTSATNTSCTSASTAFTSYASTDTWSQLKINPDNICHLHRSLPQSGW